MMLNFFINAFNNHLFLFITSLACFFVKSYLLGLVTYYSLRGKQLSKLWFLLMCVLSGSLFGDIAWILKLSRQLIFPAIDYSVLLFFIRIGWAFLALQYQSFALFLDNITQNSFRVRRGNMIFVVISIMIFVYFTYTALFETQSLTKAERDFYLNQSLTTAAPYEIIAMRFSSLYLLAQALWAIVLLMHSFKKLQQISLPRILRRQVLIIIVSFIAPYLISDFLMVIHFFWRSIHAYTPLIVGFSTMLLTIGIFYCIHRIVGLRFLNCKNQVESSPRVTFIHTLQATLEQLQKSHYIEDLHHFSEDFFENNFNIMPHSVSLILRNAALTNKVTGRCNVLKEVENAITEHGSIICPLIKEDKILIYDDLALSNFYNAQESNQIVLQLLESINADIFLPIFEKDRMIAFITIEKNARKEFFSNVDRTEMILYAKYLATNIISLIHDTNTCLHQEKKLKEDLYKKHQEIAHYKESIRSFLNHSQSQEIGILFYQNSRFEFANETAKKIAQGLSDAHPLNHALQKSAHHVQQYKTPYNCFTCDGKGNRYHITAVYNAQGNNCIISISKADLTDSINTKLALLKDPRQFDYLLYLETTKPGHRINQLIPGHSPALLNFKLDFLELALTKSSAFIEAHAHDLKDLVFLMHETSDKEQLESILLDETTNADEIHSLLFDNKDNKTRLLETLNRKGTLYIDQIQFLKHSTQVQLANIMKYGFFTEANTGNKIYLEVNIICSSKKKIACLVQEGLFAAELYEELKKNMIVMPCLSSFNESELLQLAKAYLQQQNYQLPVNNTMISGLFQFNDHKAISLSEFKTFIQKNVLSQRIERQSLGNDYMHSIKPELVQAARLGKQALKDPALMSSLWATFKNQAKIADYLGVNRSSVNRRCKEYSLE